MIQDYVYNAVCTNVVDGDTIDVSVDLGFNIYHKMRMRLLRINTPEMNSSIEAQRKIAKEAKEFVANRILGKSIIIQSFKSDSFGRWLAEIWYNDGEEFNINSQLLETGLAVEYKK